VWSEDRGGVVRRPRWLWPEDLVCCGPKTMWGRWPRVSRALEARVTWRRGPESGWASRLTMAVSLRIGSRLNEEVRVTLEPTRSRINPRVAGGVEGIGEGWGYLCEVRQRRADKKIFKKKTAWGGGKRGDGMGGEMRRGIKMSVTLKRVTRKEMKMKKTGAGVKCPDGRSAGREVSIRDSPLTMRYSLYLVDTGRMLANARAIRAQCTGSVSPLQHTESPE